MAYVPLVENPKGVVPKLAAQYARRRFGRDVEPVGAASHHSGVLVAGTATRWGLPPLLPTQFRDAATLPFIERVRAWIVAVPRPRAMPWIVLIIAILILTFLLVYIVPKFQQIFNDMLAGFLAKP